MKLEGLSWVYSPTYSKVIYGYQLVLMIWTDGVRRISLALELYRPGSITKIEIALKFLSYARNVLGLRPCFVIFDSWFAAAKVLKRIRNYGWYFITRLKKNRCFNGTQLRNYRDIPYWSEVGFLREGIRVFVVRHRNKYYATNKLSLARKELIDLYRKRQQVEETIRQLKQECCINDCQVRSIKAQIHHFYLSLCAFCILEKERLKRNISLYNLRKLLIFRKLSISIPHLDSLSAFA